MSNDKTTHSQTLVSACSPLYLLQQSTNHSNYDYNRSSAKRLFAPVFRIIDHEQNQAQIATFSSDVLDRSNGITIMHLMNDPQFNSYVYDKLRIEGNYNGFTYPILTVSCSRFSSCYNINVNHQLQSKCKLSLTDLYQIFQRFGQLYNIIMCQQNNKAYIMFTSFINCFVSYKILNNLYFHQRTLKLQLQWTKSEQYILIGDLSFYSLNIKWPKLYHQQNQQQQENINININNNFNFNYNSNKNNNYCSNNNYYPNNSTNNNNNTTNNNSTNNSNNNNYNNSNKLTCRYDIQIQNEKQFQVARRIIGTKGINMKKIIQQCLMKYKINQNIQNNNNSNELLKLRLRGHGSGYRQGIDKLESNENLHLCVSAKDEIIYKHACLMLEQLLQNIYKQYYEYNKNIKNTNIILLKPKKMKIQSNNYSNQDDNYFYFNKIGINNNLITTTIQYKNQYYQQNNNRIQPNKIIQLLQLRNKARRQLKFIQADKIRNYLRKYGVCLIDQKGRRGKVTDVTTWKYLF